MSFIQPSISQQLIDDITSYVNSYRMKNQSPALAWDSKVASFSQQWSFYLANNSLFQHSGSQNYGENLALFQGYGNDTLTLFKTAIDMWYAEIKDYNFNNPQFSSATGHFTCLVWKASTTFGMGISINSINNTAYITFNTAPPGNVNGQFQDNVLPVLIPGPIPNPNPIPIPTPNPNPIPTPTPNPQPPSINKNGFIMSLYRILTMIRQNKPANVVMYYLNETVNNLYVHGSLTTNIINSLYNAMYLIHTKQSRKLVNLQITRAIQLLHEL